jgi:hypothetical protein
MQVPLGTFETIIVRRAATGKRAAHLSPDNSYNCIVVEDKNSGKEMR